VPPADSIRKRLLVEGRDDKWVVINLMRHHGADWGCARGNLPEIHACGGVEPLLQQIRTNAKSYEKFGVLVDANSVGAGEDRWAQVKARFGEATVVFPDRPDAKGTIVPGPRNGSRAGVWVMPDNTSPGNLESFLATLVPDGDACWPYAEDATTRAKELGAPFSDGDRLKARVHTWLAWQEAPGRPFGTALTACYFDHDSEEALGFVSWFQRLFLD